MSVSVIHELTEEILRFYNTIIEFDVEITSSTIMNPDDQLVTQEIIMNSLTIRVVTDKGGNGIPSFDER